jgi:class 3 adenylate cyclase
MNEPLPAELPAQDREQRGAGLPLSLPPRLVDGAAVAVVALLYGAFLIGGFAGAPQVRAQQHHLVAMAVVAPALAALWWRRQHPLPVLAVWLIAAVFASPVAMIPLLIALYSATQRLRGWRVLAGWTLAAAACMILGSIFARDSVWPSQIVTGITGAGLGVALGLWTGVRSAYVARLHERALFARALASFLPPELAELIRASPSALSLEGEVDATVLFSDIRGFSTFAEQVPPRRVAQVVGRHLAAMAEVVRLHGGMLDKFAGDAVMAVFGVPKATADHAARAIACAVAMQQRQAELNHDAPALGLPCTHIGIGINSGTVVTGLVGGAGRLHYTVFGDNVNLAQRLESAASAGEILASAATAAKAAWPTAAPARSMLVKGRKQPVETYRVNWQGTGTDLAPR